MDALRYFRVSHTARRFPYRDSATTVTLSFPALYKNLVRSNSAVSELNSAEVPEFGAEQSDPSISSVKARRSGVRFCSDQLY